MLDGEGAYTAVEGEKAFMSPGDFVITANWAPHDHGNTSKKPMLWLDVLDFPQVNFFEGVVCRAVRARPNRPTQDGDSLAFYGSGVLPDGTPARPNSSPVINYTYARTRPIVERMMKAGDIDKRHGARVRYANPVNGGPVLPTMGAQLAMFPKGFKGEKYRSTDGTIFVCAEGAARPRSTARCWNGARGTSSWFRRGSITPTTPPRSRCCSRSPTAPRRKRSAFGARTRGRWLPRCITTLVGWARRALARALPTRLRAAPRQRVGTAHAVEPVAGILRACTCAFAHPTRYALRPAFAFAVVSRRR